MVAFSSTIYLVLMYTLAVDAFFVPNDPSEKKRDSNSKLPKDLDTAIADTMKVIEMVQNVSDGNQISPLRRIWLDLRKIFQFSSTTPPPIPKTDVSLRIILIEVLQNVTEVLQRLNKNIEVQNYLNPLRVVPLEGFDEKSYSYRRRKRNAEDLKDSGDQLENSSVSDPSTTPGVISAPVTGTLVDSVSLTPEAGRPVIAHTNPNMTNTDVDFRASHTVKAGTMSRPNIRMYVESDPVTTKKLQTVLNNTLNDLAVKIQPVQKIKEAYSKNSTFKMGYMVAKIDALEAIILNLRSEMESQKALWADKMLEIFDTIQISDKELTRLIQTVEEITRKR